MRKTILTIFTLVFAILANGTEARLNINIDGIRDGIKLQGRGFHEETVVGRCNWLTEIACTLSFQTPFFDSENWCRHSVAFTPGRDGVVTVRIQGAWAPDPSRREWFLLDEVILDGKAFGSFRNTVQSGGKTVPAGFWLNGKCGLLPDAGENGRPALLGNADHFPQFSIKVDANREYVLSFHVKAAGSEVHFPNNPQSEPIPR